MNNEYRLYYHETGQIWGHDTGTVDEPTMYADAAFIMIPRDELPDRTTHAVDLETKAIRPMTADERLRFNLPTAWDLTCVREVELTNTDWREGKPGQEAWTTYRQTLRDITKAGGPLEMLTAWPKRPDGGDAIEIIRKRTIDAQG